MIVETLSSNGLKRFQVLSILSQMLTTIIETLSSNGFEAVLSVINSLADVDDDRRDIVFERFEVVLSVINSLTDVDDDRRDIVFERFEAVRQLQHENSRRLGRRRERRHPFLC